MNAEAEQAARADSAQLRQRHGGSQSEQPELLSSLSTQQTAQPAHPGRVAHHDGLRLAAPRARRVVAAHVGPQHKEALVPPLVCGLNGREGRWVAQFAASRRREEGGRQRRGGSSCVMPQCTAIWQAQPAASKLLHSRPQPQPPAARPSRKTRQLSPSPRLTFALRHGVCIVYCTGAVQGRLKGCVINRGGTWGGSCIAARTPCMQRSPAHGGASTSHPASAPTHAAGCSLAFW